MSEGGQPYLDHRNPPTQHALRASDLAPSSKDGSASSVTYSLSAPTKQQQWAAILLLKDEDPEKVCAYLRLARALSREYPCNSGQSVLPDDQVRAIFSLRGQEDASIQSWLGEARRTFGLNTSQSFLSGATAVHGPNSVANSSYTLDRPPLSFPDAPANESPANSLPTQADWQIAAQQLANRVPDSPPLLAKAADVPRPYSCTVCGSRRSYQNHSDWKKHEKEHETTYFCPAGYLQESSGTSSAGHGGMSAHPDLDMHMGPLCHFSCKRRDHMVFHLRKQHKIPEASEARDLADKWRRTTGKRFWSCGFCVRCFTSFTERLKHIGSEHYERNQRFEEWDRSILIKGLLMQPGVKEAWEQIMELHHLHHVAGLIWEGPAIDHVLVLLELGPSAGRSAESLATAAYEAVKLESQLATAPSATPALKEMHMDFRDAGARSQSSMPGLPLLEHIPDALASAMDSDANLNSNINHIPAYEVTSTDIMLDGSYIQGGTSGSEKKMSNEPPSSGHSIDYASSDLSPAFEHDNESTQPMFLSAQVFYEDNGL